jgi:2-C-methyl-D-erythritol 4-phosphate cytidylyltransferase
MGPAAAILAAAGRGERAGGDGSNPKQFRRLGGKPLVAWSLGVLAEAGCDPIIVVVPPKLLERAQALVSSRLGALLVPGGSVRQDSVARGLELVPGDRVVVHDGARPFVTVELVHRALDALHGFDGAVVAVEVDETLKRARAGRVVETVDRSDLWRAQTPQAFRTKTLRLAHERARQEGFVGTDDAQLVERYGGGVAVVHGTRSNIKLTHPEDFALAESIVGSW